MSEKQRVIPKEVSDELFKRGAVCISHMPNGGVAFREETLTELNKKQLAENFGIDFSRELPPISQLEWLKNYPMDVERAKAFVASLK